MQPNILALFGLAAATKNLLIEVYNQSANYKSPAVIGQLEGTKLNLERIGKQVARYINLLYHSAFTLLTGLSRVMDQLTRNDLRLGSVDDDILFFNRKQWSRSHQAVEAATISQTQKPKVKQIAGTLAQVIDRHLSTSEPTKIANVSGVTFNVNDLNAKWNKYTLAQFVLYLLDVFDWEDDRTCWQHTVDLGVRQFDNFDSSTILLFPLIKLPMAWVATNFHPEGWMRKRLRAFISRQSEFGINRPISGESDHMFGDISESEHRNSDSLLFLAADKTAAYLLSKLIYLLASNCRIQAKLREFILSNGTTECEYLNWCINEGLRLFPLVMEMSTCPMIDQAKESQSIVAHSSLHIIKEEIYEPRDCWNEDAREFKPERWAGKSSFGPNMKREFQERYPIINETKHLLCNLVCRYQFELVPESEPGALESPLIMIIDSNRSKKIIRFRRTSV